MNDFDNFADQWRQQNEKLNLETKRAEDYAAELEAVASGNYITPISTGLTCLDPYFNFFYGMLALFTGYGQSGKSEILKFFACVHVFMKRGRVAIFSPESETPILIDECIRTVCFLMNVDYKTGRKIVQEYFYFLVIAEEVGMPEVDDIIKESELLSKNHGVNFYTIDPMNWLTSSNYTNGMFEALRLTLTYLKQFAKRSRSIVTYVEHPKTPQMLKDGSYPPANWRMVNGGTMHFNKVDALVVMHRRKQVDPVTQSEIMSNSDDVIFDVQKLKMQRYLGHPRPVELSFNFKTGIYEGKSFTP